MPECRRLSLPACALFLLASGNAFGAEATLAPFGAVGAAPTAPWHVVGLPQQTKPFTRFSVVDIDGKRAIKIEADDVPGRGRRGADRAERRERRLGAEGVAGSKEEQGGRRQRGAAVHGGGVGVGVRHAGVSPAGALLVTRRDP